MILRSIYRDSGENSISFPVTRKLPWSHVLLTLLVLLTAASGQEKPGTAVELYRKLGQAGIDPAQVFQVRDAAIDREDIHISLNDGTIGFLEPVNGHITGAIFVGEGELLLVPPDLTEKQSLALFTKSAVLSEKFTVAYFRFFDDDLVASLRPALREAEGKDEFLQKYSAIAKSLSASDALRELIAISLERKVYEPQSTQTIVSGGFLRARLSGVHLGTFDVVLDTQLAEQVFAGQASYSDKGVFYDQWVSFPMRQMRQQKRSPEDSLQIVGYSIKCQVHPPEELSVDASLNINVLSPGDRVLAFELSQNLKISEVTLGSGSAAEKLEFIQNEALQGSQVSRRGNDLVAVVLPRPAVAGEKLQLNFRYSGAVMAEAGGGLLYVGARGIWYPNRGPWMSNFDLEFRTPRGWKLLATGKPISMELQDGEEISHWKSEQPIPLAGFNLGKYLQASTKTSSGKPELVESYAARAMENTYAQQRKEEAPMPTPGRHRRESVPDLSFQAAGVPDPAKNALGVAQQAANTIDFLTPKIGPYPFSSLALTQMPGTDSQGWPGLVYLSSYVFLTPQERWRGPIQEKSPDEILFNRVMAAHETAHQWWGDAVFYQSYRDQWVMEALANYMALLQLETENPEYFKVVMDNYRDELLKPVAGGLAIKDAGAVTLGQRLNSSKFVNAYDMVAYGRGTWLIHMLRHMLRDAVEHPQTRDTASRMKSPGAKKAKPASEVKSDDPDALFFSVLRNIQQKFATKVMSTHDLQSAFEQVLPPSLRFEGKANLDWFFDGWVGGTAIPKFELDDVKVAASAGSTLIRLKIRQKHANDLLVTSVPIYAVLPDNKTVFVQRVFADGEETDVKLLVPQGTRKLLLDPNETVLREK